MHRIGMMQGRLLPPVAGRIQAFPGARWAEEFPLLRQIGYDAIELTIEQASWETHPIRSADGRQRLFEVAAANAIGIVGLCCDNFMELPLTSDDTDVRSKSLDQLRDLIEHAAAFGLPMVEVPMMAANSLRSETARLHFDQAMAAALPEAEKLGVSIALESDLPPQELAALVDGYANPRLGLNYDMGNSTWLGFVPEDELPLYCRHVRNVHVKDCTVKDYSLPLGRGDTPFERVFGLLAQFDYRGDFILQAARQDDCVGSARDYLAFTRECLHGAWGPRQRKPRTAIEC